MSMGARSIDEFAKANRFSRSTFYNLMKHGKAPKTFLVGRRRLVSDQAAAEWQRAMEDQASAMDGK
jgi:predicted DNA-binding transcriptional regulator AlpA